MSRHNFKKRLFNLWDVDLGMDLLCRSERVCLTLVDTANQFSEVVLPVCTPTSNL